MNSVITVLYFNGRVYEDNDGVIFEGSKKAIQIKRGISFNALKKKIGDKVKLQNNEIISAISCRFLVSGKYIALQICDDEDVETMLESFKQQQEMSVLELYIEKDVAGGSMFHSANSLTSCGNYVSNDYTQPPTNMSNLNLDEDDDHDDDDYLVSNSYVEESLDEDDSVDGISVTDNEVPEMIPPVRIVHPAEGVQGIQNPFWNDALDYNNINWSHPDEEDICGLEMPSTFNVGQELYVGMEFDSKDAVKNAVKQYVMRVHQSFKVVESKWDKYVVCCLNRNADCPCPFYMRSILSKKTDSWKVTQWGGPHTCLNMTMTQDHEKLDSDLIATCVVAYTPCKHIFDQNLEKFRELSPAIATWIDRISKEKWTMAYDREGRRYGHMTTNLSECINKVLKDCRNIPITALVKSTYSRCRKYFVERGRQAQRQLNEGQVYCSKLVKELRKNQEQACTHIVRVYDIHSTRFEVEESFNPITQRGGQKWAVNLNDRHCQCGRYSALHYPCSHIIAACGYVSMNYYQYIDVVYTNEHILKAYSAQWWPLGNEAAITPSDDAWTLIPDPTTIRAKGRPKSTRIRNEMDWVEPSEHRTKCSRCGAEGHNRRRCPMQSERGSCSNP
ncbi:hypothetical protein GmHk_05G013553 [Glycine max]|nr:hypothetical protein GmHk_05G013553 [Glycine max]